MLSVETLLNPKSIAIIGASNDIKKVGGIVTQNIVARYKGLVYPVNPKEETIQGLINYKTIVELPDTPDLAILAIPAEKVLDVLPQIGDKGIKNLLIFSAGFKEAGDQGKILEQKLLDLAGFYKFNILGPNCLGFVNNEIGLNATFASTPKNRGNLNIFSQSGAIATSFFDWCSTNNLGFDNFVTLGNKSVLNENHFLEFISQTKTYQEPGLSSLRPTGLYLESISSGIEFAKIAAKISKDNPIFILKPGKSPEASSAMQSHTGSLAGSDEVFESVLKESGVIRADTMQEFFNLGMALSWENVPQTNKIAIISNAGGPGVISADAVSASSLQLATLSEQTQKTLAEHLPRMAGLHNPIDVLGDALADRFTIALDAVLTEVEVSAVIVILTPQLMTEIEKTAQTISALSAKYQKPIYCSFVGGRAVYKGDQILNTAKIPNFAFPEEAIRTMSLVFSWQLWRQNQIEAKDQNLPTPIVFPGEINSLLSQNENIKLLNPNSASQIFNYLRLPIPDSVITKDPQSAEEFVNNIGWPVVLKIADPSKPHKSDSGGVVTGITSFVELRQNWLKLSPNQDSPLQVQKQLKNDYEIFLGFKRDPNFGNYIVVGLGGKLVNLTKDANLCLLPITEIKLEESLKNSPYYKLFTGYRDFPQLNFHEFAKQIQVLSDFFTQFTKITEMEINPIIINASGHFYSDIKIYLN